MMLRATSNVVVVIVVARRRLDGVFLLSTIWIFCIWLSRALAVKSVDRNISTTHSLLAV